MICAPERKAALDGRTIETRRAFFRHAAVMSRTRITVTVNSGIRCRDGIYTYIH